MDNLADRINAAVKVGWLPLRTYTRVDWIQEARGQGKNLQVRLGRKTWVYLVPEQRARIDRALANHGF